MRAQAAASATSAASPILPRNVEEQISLWENERNRMISNDACLYQEFESLEEFFSLKQYTAQREVLLWATQTPPHLNASSGLTGLGLKLMLCTNAVRVFMQPPPICVLCLMQRVSGCAALSQDGREVVQAFTNERAERKRKQLMQMQMQT
jgi:hypothetical protein